MVIAPARCISTDCASSLPPHDERSDDRLRHTAGTTSGQTSGRRALLRDPRRDRQRDDQRDQRAGPPQSRWLCFDHAELRSCHSSDDGGLSESWQVGPVGAADARCHGADEAAERDEHEGRGDRLRRRALAKLAPAHRDVSTGD